MRRKDFLTAFLTFVFLVPAGMLMATWTGYWMAEARLVPGDDTGGPEFRRISGGRVEFLNVGRGGTRHVRHERASGGLVALYQVPDLVSVRCQASRGDVFVVMADPPGGTGVCRELGRWQK